MAQKCETCKHFLAYAKLPFGVCRIRRIEVNPCDGEYCREWVALKDLAK